MTQRFESNSSDRDPEDTDIQNIPEKESKIAVALEYVFYVWFFIGPPLLLFSLYYFRDYYKKHNYIYIFLLICVILYVVLQSILLLAMMI
jgi:hypothetical protein